jgi:hypothetical protein
MLMQILDASLSTKTVSEIKENVEDSILHDGML